MARGNAKNFGDKGGGKPGNKGRGDTDARKVAAAFRKFCHKVVMSPAAQKMLKEKFESATLHPSIMSLLIQYNAGKVPDASGEEVKAVPVRIEHIYPDSKPDEAK
jgi:hypothetical protein